MYEGEKHVPMNRRMTQANPTSSTDDLVKSLSLQAQSRKSLQIAAAQVAIQQSEQHDELKKFNDDNKNVHVGDRISNVALLQVFIFMSVQNDSVLNRRHCCGQYLSEFNDQNSIFVIERNRREQ